MNLDNVYLKYLIRSHTIVGVFVVFFFYLSTFFGTITLFKPYLHSWENVSRHFSVVDNSKLDLDIAVQNALEKLQNPSNNVQILLPSFGDKALSVHYGFSEKVYINPNTNKVLETTNERDFITNFFNHMHISLNIPKVGQIVVGITSIAILFLSISGFYLWLISRKKRSTVKSFWLKWHKDLSLILLPYILIFSLTGSVLGVMLVSSSPFALSATDGKEENMSKLVRPIVFAKDYAVKKSGQNASMLKISELYAKGQKLYPELLIRKIILDNWNDKNAYISFRGYLKDNRALTGTVNRQSVILSAVDGSLLKKKTLNDSHSMAKLLSGFYFLHFLPDEGLVVRILFLFFGIIFLASMVFGILIWLEKKSSKDKDNANYFTFISKFSLSLFIGIIPASSFLLFLYWALPFDLAQRETWIVGGFYSLWSFTLFFSVYEQKTINVIKVFMTLNFILLIMTVLFHGLRTDFFIWNSLEKGLYELFFVDLLLLIFAFLSLVSANKVSKIKLLEKI